MRPWIDRLPGFQVLKGDSGHPLTDFIGIQEESTSPNIRRKCFVLRTSTERQEAVSAGFAELVGVKPKNVLTAVDKWWKAGAKVPSKKSPFGPGNAAERSVARMKREGYC